LKTFLGLICVVMAAVIIGCGGGGGGGSTTGTTDTTTATTATSIRPEATLASDTSQTIDLDNVQPGDQLQLRLWGRNPDTGNAVIVGSSGWSTDAPASVLTVSSSGLLSAISANAASYTVSSNGGKYSATVRVKSPAARVVGFIRNEAGIGATRAKINFYDNSGAIISSAFTGSNGTFGAAVPAAAKTFLVDMSERAGVYYNQFGFGPHDYNLSCTNRAPLPTLATGSTFTLVSSGGGSIEVNRIIAGSPPPPPPDCGLGG
jgi:hypothetical protein